MLCTGQGLYPEAFYEPGLLDALGAVEEELACRGGFLPLMPLFPGTEPRTAQQQQPAPGAGAGKEGQVARKPLPWSAADLLVRAWCKDRDRVLAAALRKQEQEAVLA